MRDSRYNSCSFPLRRAAIALALRVTLAQFQAVRPVLSFASRFAPAATRDWMACVFLLLTAIIKGLRPFEFLKLTLAEAPIRRSIIFAFLSLFPRLPKLLESAARNSGDPPDLYTALGSAPARRSALTASTLLEYTALYKTEDHFSPVIDIEYILAFAPFKSSYFILSASPLSAALRSWSSKFFCLRATWI